MRSLLFSILTWVFSWLALNAQTPLPITNNMQISGNSNIKLLAGKYVFQDTEGNGVIQITGQSNIILDGDSCYVDGLDYTGYMIRIENSHNIILKNFDSVFRYKYAVYIMNSDHIVINNNVFSHNKVDSAGWIEIWTDYQQALGGGVMMYQCRSAELFDNNMTMQNDGVALYHCDSIRLFNNDFSWNTSFGIRMYWTDSCEVFQNNCSHVNRPYTDPSDCAALLMLVSNENRVEYNDLSWSGDGVFLGQYQHSDIPNNNYFAYNECSYSPHNAIEATFADGNVYKHNKCNHSHYGFWLGYSFNTLADSNEVIGNYQSGIAIDRGFNNVLINNQIIDNPTGIELWEGSPIGGYTNQYSKDYIISGNHFEGNTLAVSLNKTENSYLNGNDFLYSQTASVLFEGTATGDTLTSNRFIAPTMYHLKNNSTNDIFAPGNTFFPGDSLLVEEKIYDESDLSTKGRVLWSPPDSLLPSPVQANPPCDMAEPGSLWYAYPETGYPPVVKFADTVSFDYIEKMVGDASVKLVTGRGWYLGLNYRPGTDSLSNWQLTDDDTLYFWVRTIKQPVYGFQYFHIRIGDGKGNYYRYNSSPNYLNSANQMWRQYKCPVAGGTGFYRTEIGEMDPDQVNYVEFDADTWDYGFTLWVDGVQFEPCDPVTDTETLVKRTNPALRVWPNPSPEGFEIELEVNETQPVCVEIYDLYGRFMATVISATLSPGQYRYRYSPGEAGSDLKACGGSLYVLRLTSPAGVRTVKLVRIK